MELKLTNYAVENGIATIAMNSPKNLNAINGDMCAELLYHFAAAEADEAVKVIVLKGLPRAFSAGGDIGSMAAILSDPDAYIGDEAMEPVAAVTNTMKSMSKVVITAVSGAAAGAGVGVALSGDFCICAENVKFILAFVNLGLCPDTGAAYMIAKAASPALAADLAMTGRPMGPEEALKAGLIYKVVDNDELEEEAYKLAKRLAAGPVVSYKNTKKQIYTAAFADYWQWLREVEAPTQAECSKTADFREGVRAFGEKRKANFQGK